MDILNAIPLVGAILGILLAVAIASGAAHANNKPAKIILILIVVLNAHTLFESYLFYNNLMDINSLGLSYLHYHLIGFLFLIYTNYLFKISRLNKIYTWFLIIYSIVRIIVLFKLEEDVNVILTQENETYTIIVMIDYLVASLLNISTLFFSYLRIKKLKFAVTPSKTEMLEYQWLKYLLLIAGIIFVALLVTDILAYYSFDELLVAVKFESVVMSLFFLGIAFLAFRFPVFAVSGDYKDLVPEQIDEESQQEEKKVKYEKSSLKEDNAAELWQRILNRMVEEKPFLNPEYRLNDLAKNIGSTLHHVSQVINEKEGISFTDFINKYRVEEAKLILLSPRSEQITILAIAFEVGFNSKTAFYNAFKKNSGQTPSAFKKNNSI